MRPYRSVLFVPGHRPTWVDKAVASGADAIVLDLEDSVPEAEKAAARATVAESIARVRATNSDIGLFVRVNPLHTKLTGADLEAVVVPGLTGIFAAEDRAGHRCAPLRRAARPLRDAQRGQRAGVHHPGRDGQGHPELPRDRAAASPRVGAMIGPTAEHADIARAVGYEWTPEGLETLYLRSRILLACREAGIHALTGLWEDLDNLDGLRGVRRGAAASSASAA